ATACRSRGRVFWAKWTKRSLRSSTMFTWRLCSNLCLLVALTATQAVAQPSPAKTGTDENAPTRITSKTMTVKNQEGKAIFQGEVSYDPGRADGASQGNGRLFPAGRGSGRPTPPGDGPCERQGH